jgi:hypothetical protein
MFLYSIFEKKRTLLFKISIQSFIMIFPHTYVLYLKSVHLLHFSPIIFADS